MCGDVGYYSNHSTWHTVHGTHGYFCFYNFARLSAPDPRSGAARSSRLLQMVYVRCVLRLMDTGLYAENRGQDRVWSHIYTVSFNKRISHVKLMGPELSRK